jgi:type VI secretion system secreted protein VgrG
VTNDASGAIHTLAIGQLSSEQLNVLSFEGREEVNALYSFDIVFWTRDLDATLAETALLAAPASLGMVLAGNAACHPKDGPREHVNATRHVHGVIASVSPGAMLAGERQSYRVSLVPRLWLLQKRITSRIFQDLDVQEILDLVLEEHGVEREFRLNREYLARQYCVQYQESDLQFVTRLCAEEGIFFFFDHPEDEVPLPAERLIFGDDSSSYATIEGDPTLVERRQNAQSAIEAAENQVNDFHVLSRVETSAVEMRDYDFQRPLLSLVNAASTPEQGVFPVTQPLESYEHHGDYEETDVSDPNANVRLEQHRARVREASGASACRRLLPGRTFDLTEHEHDALNRRWVLTRLEHRGVSTEAAKDGRRVYDNHFRAVPGDIAVRPPRPARVTRQALENAIVVGPEGQEIFTDQYGRVKVQFYWDREGSRDAFSSCWIRVMQPWAGTGFGFQFIPRIGMEVVVSFLGGDLDRPILLGCLYNAINPTPHILPAQSTRSGIRTRSTPGGGGSNEITFEDLANNEQLFVHAQRNFDAEVGLDRTENVGRDSVETTGRDRKSEVAQHRHDATGGDHRVIINGGRSVAIASRDDLDVRGPRRVRVGGPAETTVAGPAQLTIDGARTTSIQGDDTLRIRRDATLVIDGAASCDVLGESRLSFSDKLSINAGGGITLAVGGQTPAPAAVSLSGDMTVKGSGTLQLSSDTRVEIRVGKSVLTLLPDEVRIESDKITLNAKSIEATGEEGGLSVGKEVSLRGNAVKLASKDDAILELDKEARLDGKVVKIKPGLAAEMAKREEREAQAKEVGTTSVSLFDLSGELIPNAPYEVSFFGYLDQGTAGAGVVDIPAFPDVERAHVRWGRPKDKREDPEDQDIYEWEMDVYLKVDADSPEEGLRRKLHNLGHIADSLSTAIRHYQDSLRVDRTGAVADAASDIQTRHATAAPVPAEEPANA